MCPARQPLTTAAVRLATSLSHTIHISHPWYLPAVTPIPQPFATKLLATAKMHYTPLLTVILGMLIGAAPIALALPSPEAEGASVPSPREVEGTVQAPPPEIIAAALARGNASSDSRNRKIAEENAAMGILGSGFAQTCSSIGVHNSFTLLGCCTKNNGARAWTSLWLGHCLANDGGNIVARVRGALDWSCRVCSYLGGAVADYGCYCDGHPTGNNHWTQHWLVSPILYYLQSRLSAVSGGHVITKFMANKCNLMIQNPDISNQNGIMECFGIYGFDEGVC